MFEEVEIVLILSLLIVYEYSITVLHEHVQYYFSIRIRHTKIQDTEK